MRHDDAGRAHVERLHHVNRVVRRETDETGTPGGGLQDPLDGREVQQPVLHVEKEPVEAAEREDLGNLR